MLLPTTTRLTSSYSSLSGTLLHKPPACRAIVFPPVIAPQLIRVRKKSTFGQARSLSGSIVHRPGSEIAGNATELDISNLSRLRLSTLVRNILLGYVFTSPMLLRQTIPIMERIANSQGGILNLDRNPILRAVMKQAIYNHFCAGVNEKEISQTRDAIKSMGFSGVVLCFGKEVQITRDQTLVNTGSKELQSSAEIQHWRDGTLETVDMTKEGDWIGIKLTGAGPEVTNALVNQTELPSAFLEALDSICERAELRGCKIWMDAEQQAVQPGIDACTINLMRRCNRDGRVLVYNTLQSYLKASRDKLKHQLALSKQEGWQLAIKLVRGAYMANDQREKIHDTKEDTDASYEGLISDILQGTNLGFAPGQAPQMQLLIAGHNPDSVIGAFDLMKQLHAQGTLKVRPDFAQLQGMADVLGCDLIRRCEDFARQTSEQLDSAHVPRTYKCLTWGSVQECIQYLYRRMVENGTASDRMRDGLSAHVAELRRRVLG